MRSTASLLGPEGSSLVISRTPNEAALLVVQLLGQRGYALVEQQQAGATSVLRMKHTPQELRTHRFGEVLPRRFSRIDAVFYAFIDPHGASSSAITIFARPALDGEELCTSDAAIAGPCAEIYLEPDGDLEVAAANAAEVVRGALTELRLLGLVDEDARPARRIALERERCREERRSRMERVRAHRDSRARASAYEALIKNYPSCS
ncbi:MAG: hypothetical protein ACTHU0_13565 [Kofleriaceae bacterium]